MTIAVWKLMALGAGLLALAVAAGGWLVLRGDDRTPEQIASAYVRAIDAHDGGAICGLLERSWQEKLSGPRGPGCATFVGGMIGYGEESDTTTFVSGRLVSTGKPYPRSNLGHAYLAVPLTLRYVMDKGNSGTDVPFTFHDVLWLERVGGSWRIAKPSRGLYAAWAAYNVPGGLLDVPDPLGEKHAAAVSRTTEQAERAAYERSFAAPARTVPGCVGRTLGGADPGSEVRMPGADLRRVTLTLGPRTDCFRVELAGPVLRGVDFAFTFCDAAGRSRCYSAGVDVRDAGHVRVGHPTRMADWTDSFGRSALLMSPVPGARVAIDGRVLSLSLPRPALPATWTAPAVVVSAIGPDGTGDTYPDSRTASGPVRTFMRLSDGEVVQAPPRG